MLKKCFLPTSANRFGTHAQIACAGHGLTISGPVNNNINNKSNNNNNNNNKALVLQVLITYDAKLLFSSSLPSRSKCMHPLLNQ
jgi:hypothetical protein